MSPSIFGRGKSRTEIIAPKNRRLFHRAEITANGEFVWATKNRLGRVKTHREFVTTTDISVEGAKIRMDGNQDFPVKFRGRMKLGLHFCDVEVLESEHVGDSTVLRLLFLAPNQQFIEIIEQWMPISQEDRSEFKSAWL